MAEYIQNGDFANEFTHWVNGPGDYTAFAEEGEQALAEGNAENTDLVQFAMYQEVTIPTGATVLLARLDVWRNTIVWEGTTFQGSCVNTVKIQKPDNSWVTVKTETVDSEEYKLGYLLQGENVLSSFDQTGTYKIYLYVDVRSSRSGTVYQQNKTYYDNISLEIGFSTPSEELLLGGKTNKKVYEFSVGSPTGRFDTDDLDFGYPDMEKTLDYVAFESHAAVLHTVDVYVSTDSGRTWSKVGSASVRKGQLGQVYPWLTGERFRISFRGSGLYLHTIEAHAIPRGPLKEST